MKARRKKVAKEDQRCDESPTPHLPDHVLIEIFCRLPIKTLMAVKCVSRSWLNLVSDTHFAKLHRHRSPTELLLLRGSDKLFLATLQHQKSVVSGIKRNLLFNLPKLSIRSNNTIIWNCGNGEQMDFNFVNSCNGLLCFSGSRHTLICNPITDEFITVPLTELKWGYDCLFSLGFSGKENRYKLLQIMYRWEKLGKTWAGAEVEFEICTLEKGSSWRNLGDCPLSIGDVSYSSPSPSPCLFFEGKLHFVRPRSIDMKKYINCFDFDNEKFGKVPLPNVGTGRTIDVRVLGGRLSVTRFGREECIEIWVMKEYGVQDSWTKSYTVHKWGHKHVKDCTSRQLRVPLVFLRNAEIVKYLKNEQVIEYTATLLRLKVALAGYEAWVWNGNSR